MSAAETEPLILPPDDWANAYFEAYTGPIGYGTITKSCRHAGVSKDTRKTRLNNDTVFAELHRLADEELKDQVSHELLRRGMMGYDKPIFQRGHLVGHVTEYDNKLLMWLAERLMPEQYHLATKFELATGDGENAFKFAMSEAPLRELESGTPPENQ